GGGELSVLPSDRHRLPGLQRVDILGLQTEQLAEGPGTGARPDPVGLVDDAAEERHDQVAAGRDVPGQVVGGGVGHQVQVGHDHEWVPGQVGVGLDDVDRDVGVPQRFVVCDELVDEGQVHGGPRLGECPPAGPVPDHGHLGGDPGSDDVVQYPQLRTQVADL